jgi:hypothetical protein
VESQARALSPQRAKNIPNNIAVYEIPALKDEMKMRVADALFEPVIEKPREATGRRAIFYSLISVGLVVASVFMVMAGISATRKSIAEENSKPSKPKSKIENGKIVPVDGSTELPDTAATKQSPSETTGSGATESPKFVFDPNQIANLKANHDFSGIVSYLQGVAGADTTEAQEIIKKYAGLGLFKTWLETESGKLTREAPLKVMIQQAESSVYSDPGGVIVETSTGASPPQPMFKWPSFTVLAIARGIQSQASELPAELSTWITDFENEYK